MKNLPERCFDCKHCHWSSSGYRCGKLRKEVYGISWHRDDRCPLEGKPEKTERDLPNFDPLTGYTF